MDNFHFICEILSDKLSAVLAQYRKLISDCADQCRKSIKNGPNYTQQVSVCTYTKKIVLIRKLITILQQYSAVPQYQKNATTMIIQYKLKLNDLSSKLMSARKTLKTRQVKVPVALSTKPSPERYNPRKDLRGSE